MSNPFLLFLPFCLMVHHKAPHRHWEPDDKHAAMYENETIPEPHTLWDDHSTRSAAAQAAKLHMMDLDEADLGRSGLWLYDLDTGAFIQKYLLR